jgi:hypothetical protein
LRESDGGILAAPHALLDLAHHELGGRHLALDPEKVVVGRVVLLDDQLEFFLELGQPGSSRIEVGRVRSRPQRGRRENGHHTEDGRHRDRREGSFVSRAPLGRPAMH